ncbi:MAG: tripartite tricarboxylate transporter substrate binding protein [Betaproteobacteria bacterium]|nr:tripartite tricarboxylate transporter substrate binding protein [Betaproteobacteria bacterium]
MKKLFTVLSAGFVALLALGPDPAMSAETYPNRPIRMVVPFAPGGNTDILARAVGQRMSDNWGTPVVVDNRPGGNGFIAAEIAAKATPDGHTVLVASSREVSINLGLFRKLPYDPEKDFAPVTLGTVSAMLFAAHPSFQGNTLRDIIGAAKARPGSVSIGTPGVGTPMHLSLELFNMLIGAKTVHVPYRGGGPLAAALLGGQEVKIGIVGMGPAIPHVRAGRVKPIAITTQKRSRLLPDVPTAQEAGLKNFDTSIWFAFYVPARTPKTIVSKLHGELVRILRLPEVVDYLENVTGVDVVPGTPQELARFARAEADKYRKIMRAAGIQAE